MKNQDIDKIKVQLPGIDYDIGVANVLGDDEIYQEIILMFYEDHSKDDENIQKAILGYDGDNCKRLVHTLKGVACSIGAMTLFEQVKLLDIAINERREGDYQHLLEALKPEFNRVIKGIEVAFINKM
ncbi:Hpt domain-containing protein [Pseudocolwellia agarivorans]|uniref:Hpt domain-containing protein n=1 Tax=Pseudocolwellia agarivorans TaxID=1911682 RepID=UPI0009856F3E|nr:Hpt domain-containing protein [Pseudocolwellia agarivorans]